MIFQFTAYTATVIAESRFQDIGTWYGLKSKLVVRSVRDPEQRSVLVPVGEPTAEREGPHISIVIKNNGVYMKFNVNTVLGRIDCPAEPVMLYYRALWHAKTAYFLPDPLTGRTGSEEALRYLQSGAYFPWNPLTQRARLVLQEIAKLSPRREYYLVGMKAMESVAWDPKLIIYKQDERYRCTTDIILRRDKDNSQFASSTIAGGSLLGVPGDLHLENRALSRTIANH
jgi:hypothetical protein